MTETKRLLLLVRTDSGSDLPADSAYLLEALKPYCGQVTVATPREMSAVPDGDTDESLSYRPQSGLAGALRSLRLSLGSESLLAFEEILVVSDQIIGPIGNVENLFARAAARPGAVKTAILPEQADPLATELCWIHLDQAAYAQPAFWKLVNARAQKETASEQWLDIAGFVNGLPEIGITPTTIFPTDEKNDFLVRGQLENYLNDGIEILPWSVFTADPLLLERWAITPRGAFEYLSGSGYPLQHFWVRILQEVPPQTWYTNLALLDIFPDTPPPANDSAALNTAVIAHVFYPDMLGEILSYAGNVPDPADLFVTTNTEEKRLELEAALAEQNRFSNYEVRVVKTNRGRDISAFLLDCEDVLRNPAYNIVVKLHSKRSVQDPASVSSWFRSHLFDNLLHSPDYVSHIYRRFADETQLGMVFPPVIHMGLPTMGNGWTLNREPAQKLAERLGITIPFDTNTPLSPYGSMFIARREALLPLVDVGFTAEEFPEGAEYRDGSTAHVLERLLSYVVFTQGYYCRCVQTSALAEISAVTLEYKLDQVSHYLHPHTIEQVKMLSGGEDSSMSWGTLRSLAARQLVTQHPRIGKVAAEMWNTGKKIPRAFAQVLNKPFQG